eukprot:3178-Heterococcus_DN1.PRE.1
MSHCCQMWAHQSYQRLQQHYCQLLHTGHLFMLPFAGSRARSTAAIAHAAICTACCSCLV